jgi:pimeloyl-ACP methyl ester carboxylesterase
MDERTVEIDGHPVALEAEPTTVIASALVASRVWEAEYASFLGNPIALKPKPSILRGLQPYARGKIPVVFVHGTASSVLRWADMMNDLLDDARIRGAFQFWFFAYDSGNPIAYSSYLLRKALSDRVAEFERDAPDPALHQMVVIGHSQGGLLTKMTAIDSGDRLWSNVSRTPLKDLRLSDETRALLQDALFIKPLPFVKRLVFICTPHRGSYLAGPQIVRRLIHRLVTLPGDLVASSAEIVGAMREGGLVDVDRLPTSIDNMDPGNRFIKALQEIPIDPGVKAHSIIAVTQTKDIEHGDDGVVKYQSAHIADVESELVVNSSHSAQANPHTIGEVKRILLEHLRVFQASAPVSHRPIARRHAHAR